MISFKGRKVDNKRTVQIYRNLHDRSGTKRWSIKQNGLVVAHAEKLCLGDVQFVVSQAGMKRAQKLGHRVVCAYARGKIIDSCMGTDADDTLPVKISFVYGEGFIGKLGQIRFVTTGAMAVIFNKHGASAAYTYKD